MCNWPGSCYNKSRLLFWSSSLTLWWARFAICSYATSVNGQVREIVSILDIDVLFYPTPKNGPNFRPKAVELGGKSQFPYMVRAHNLLILCGLLKTIMRSLAHVRTSGFFLTWLFGSWWLGGPKHRCFNVWIRWYHQVLSRQVWLVAHLVGPVSLSILSASVCRSTIASVIAWWSWGLWFLLWHTKIMAGQVMAKFLFHSNLAS